MQINSKLIIYLKRYWRNLLAGLFCLLIVSLINLSIPLIIEDFIANLSLNDNSKINSHLGIYTTILFCIFLLQAIFGYYRVHQFNLFSAKSITDLKKDIFNSILSKPASFHAKLKTADFISKLNADTQIIQEVVAAKISVAIRYGIQVLGGIVMLFVISAKLSLLIVLCLPLLVIFSIFLAKKLKNYSYQIQELQGSSGNTTEEAIKGFKTIKIFQALGKIEQIFAKRIDAIYESTVARSKLSAFFQSFVSLLLYSFIICFLAYGLYLAESGIINYSELSSFIMYAVLVAVSFSLLSSIIDDLSKAAGAYHRIGSLLNEERYDHQTIASIPEINSKLIEIEDLSFSYEDQLVLNNLNFNLQTNSLNIITGANGSGKTTFLNILLGFENNFTGDIKINDLSIRKTNLNGYFSLVAQETLILDLSVRENISLLSNKVNDQIIIEMLKELGGDFTSELPEGLDTDCGNNGTNLSGGQKQLIALVRALSSDAPIIVLDEATSALDTQRQAAVISKLKSLAKQGKTIIMISHKLEVIKNADNLVIFENDGSVQANRYEMLQDHSRYLNQMIRTN